MTSYKFKMGIFLNELQLPLDEGLEVAKDLGIEYVWFSQLVDRPPVAELSDQEIDEIGKKIDDHGLKQFIVSAGSPFKFIDLTRLDLDSMQENEDFRKDFSDMVRSMEIANRWGVGAVSVYSFAWPGEYTAEKPTWPMRWMTRGGIISDVEMDKLAKAYTLMAEQAEKHDVDLVLSMMPWNYTNTTGNFRKVAERVGSDRIKVMWGPSDNYNCGEADSFTAGFLNVKPYIHSIHTKDLRVNDGLSLDFDYLPFGEGDADYESVYQSLKETQADVVVSISTHWQPPNGSRVDAMRIQHKNVMSLIKQIEG
jgi:sugar phosphate isomerase/epimerase